MKRRQRAAAWAGRRKPLVAAFDCSAQMSNLSEALREARARRRRSTTPTTSTPITGRPSGGQRRPSSDAASRIDARRGGAARASSRTRAARPAPTNSAAAPSIPRATQIESLRARVRCCAASG